MSDCRKCSEFDWCVENEECGLFKPKPQTNADHIRSMTDEQLAKWIQNRLDDYDGKSTWMRWLDWLKTEVEA